MLARNRWQQTALGPKLAADQLRTVGLLLPIREKLTASNFGTTRVHNAGRRSRTHLEKIFVEIGPRLVL